MTRMTFLPLALAAALVLGLAASRPACAQAAGDASAPIAGTTSVRLPLNGITFAFGEPVAVSGTLHAVVKVFPPTPLFPPQPIHPYAELHANLFDGDAVGLVTGTRYLFTGADGVRVFPPQPITPSFVVAFRLFQPGAPLVPPNPCFVAIGTAVGDDGLLAASSADVVINNGGGNGP